jgi:c-di-GMP-related signal transduction protein
VVQTQQAIARQGQGSPVLAGQLYRDLGTRALVQHCLDNRQAWGVCGWPEDDVLRDHHRYGVPVDKRTLVRVQQALMREASMDVIEGLIHQDAVLTYRVLRLVNSPVFGATRQVTTVRQALMLLGQRRLSDWLLELMPGSSADRELLPVRLALVLRGRVMQALMDAGVQHDLATEIYLTGLFSRLDVLTQEPLAAALKRVPLSEPVAEALLRQSGPYAHYLDIACRLESFDQVQRLPAVCETAGFPLDQVNGGLLRTLAQWRNSL